jgi:hypothetical protein
MNAIWLRGLQAAVVVWAATALSVPAGQARADVLIEGPTDEGSRDTAGTPPVATLHHGPLTLLNVFVNDPAQTATDSDVEFNLGAVSTLPHGVVISSAILSLHVAGAQTTSNPASVSVNGYADGDGLVGLGDFVKPTTLLGNTGILSPAPPGSENIPFAFDVTNFLQTIANNRAPFVGFRLDGPPGVSDAWLWGSAAPVSAERPQLEITFTPAAAAVAEPSVALLLGVGIVILSGAAWCRRSRAVAPIAAVAI